MEKAAALCEKAVQLHQYNSSQIRALSFFQIGRIHHIEGNMEEAFNNYQNAFFLWGDNSNILFGLGQAYIYKGKLQEAKRCFERLKERFPENFHVLRILGSICRSLSDFDSAKELLIKALRIQPNYEQLAIETAQLCEITGDYGIALSIYQTIIQNSNDEPSYQLLNNVAVLLHLTSQFEKAREMYESANSAFTKQNNDENLFHPTLLFNQAFLLESQGEVQLAISNYNDLIAKCKLQGFSYIDASLRLAYLQMDSVNFTEAKKVLESISRTAEGKIPSTLILGQIAVAEDDLGLAQKLFEESVALAKFSEFQDYAELSLASILIAQFQKNRKSSNPEKQAEIKAWIKQADELYREILKRSPSNVYAANGLGVCFAAKHDHDAAYQIFTAIREQAPEMPNVYINLGHSALKRQSIQSALNFVNTFLFSLKRIDF